MKNGEPRTKAQTLGKTLFLNVIIFVGYVLSGKIGLSFASLNPSATAIWPPTGIALAALLLFGYRVVPAIFIGAFLVNLTTAGTVLTSFGIALGNTLEGIVGCYLVNKYANGKFSFRNIESIFRYVFLSAFVSTMVSADIGVTTLLFGNLVDWNNVIPVWATWWLGDMGGSLVIAPLILIWASAHRLKFFFADTVHIILSFFVLSITTWIVFSGILPYPYLCLPIVVWIAFWFGRRGATVGTILVAIIAVFYTLHHLGPFAQNIPVNQSLILLQVFISILSITALIFSTLVHEITKGEQTLATHEARFRAIIERSYDAVVLIDAASIISYATPSAKNILGFSPEELTGMTGFNLVVPEDRLFTMQTLAKLVLKPNEAVTIEYRVKRKDKKVIWVQATGTNMLLDPAIAAIVVNFHDITQTKMLLDKISHEKKVDDAMLASIGDGIVATDNTGKISMINEAACVILGFSKNELLGKDFIGKILMEDESGKNILEKDRPIKKVLQSKKKVVTSKTYYYVMKNKNRVPVRFTVTPIMLGGKIAGIIEVFHDITKEKEVEKMKEDFISMASHELRTPMTAVNGLLSMITHGDYGPINDRLKRPLRNIEISANRQIHLINDLLDVSRLQSGKINITLSEFMIKQTIDETVKSLMPLAVTKNLQLTMTDGADIRVYADPQWVKHILSNLIGNAIKFTDTGGVSISYTIQKDIAVIEVTDTGWGIEVQDRSKLFGKFQQFVGRDENKPPGSGLGLFLSRELAQKMGGDVLLVKSTVGKGTTFSYTIPLQKGVKN